MRKARSAYFKYKRTIHIIVALIFILSALNGGESVKPEELFGIPVTSWIFEGSDGINHYKFENEYPKSRQAIEADYGYYFNFQYPNIVIYTLATPITLQNGNILSAKLCRKGTFDIKGNIVTINFTEAIHRIPDTYGKLGDAMAENVIITVEAETDGRTELFIKQISGENIFTENDKYKKIKFAASILPALQ